MSVHIGRFSSCADSTAHTQEQIAPGCVCEEGQAPIRGN